MVAHHSESVLLDTKGSATERGGVLLRVLGEQREWGPPAVRSGGERDHPNHQPVDGRRLQGTFCSSAPNLVSLSAAVASSVTTHPFEVKTGPQFLDTKHEEWNRTAVF